MSDGKQQTKPYGAPRIWESMVGPVIVLPVVIGGGLLLWALIKYLLVWGGWIG